MTELWRDIPGYEGYYQVSNLGRIKSLPRLVKSKNNGVRKTKEILLKPQSDDEGYQSVGLHKENSQKDCRIHRLVAEAFIPNPENKPQVNHIDGVKYHNNVRNLEWVTNSENMIHALNSKLFVPDGKRLARISHLGTAKTSKKIRCIETGEIFVSQSAADRAYGFKLGTVSNRRISNRSVNGLHFELV